MQYRKKVLLVLTTGLLLSACAVPHQPVVNGSIGQSRATHKVVADKGAGYVATVIKVADGDTVTVQDDDGAIHKIRLAYIDAPETKQNYGLESKVGLARLINGKPVRVLVRDIDRYQREVATITSEGRDINYSQIELGNAWHYTQYAKKQLVEDYQKYQVAMARAKEKRLGLWSFDRPKAPWDYRRQQRGERVSLPD